MERKPIFVIYISVDSDILQTAISEIRQSTKFLKPDYYVLIVPTTSDSAVSFEMFNAVNMTDIQYEELQQLVLTKINENAK